MSRLDRRAYEHNEFSCLHVLLVRGRGVSAAAMDGSWIMGKVDFRNAWKESGRRGSIAADRGVSPIKPKCS